MRSQLSTLAFRAVNGTANRTARANRIERHAIDHRGHEELARHGLDLLGDGLHVPSRGLHEVPSERLKSFALHLVTHAGTTAVHVDNSRSQALPSEGHLYLYRSARLPIAHDALEFIRDNPNNAMRLCVRAFTRGALELPPGTIDRLREQVRGGARVGPLMRALRDDPQVRAYQLAQWEEGANLRGDVLIGGNSIVYISRHERHALDDGRYLVDLVNPATREFHVLDGSNIWVRVVDTETDELVFAVVGTGRHRFALMDAANNAGAMSIWQYLAEMQRELYSGVPSDGSAVQAHITTALGRCGADTIRLHRSLTARDNAPSGAVLRGLRRKLSYENGNSYA